MAGAAASMGARAVLRDKGVLFIGLGWGGFIAENLILSENRTWIIERFGETNYITVRACVHACMHACSRRACALGSPRSTLARGQQLRV
jgi:hypothetical protein